MWKESNTPFVFQQEWVYLEKLEKCESNVASLFVSLRYLAIFFLISQFVVNVLNIVSQSPAPFLFDAT